MVTTTEVEAKIDTHIDVCAVRYEGLDQQLKAVNARLKRIEYIFISAAGAIMLLMANILFKAHL